MEASGIDGGDRDRPRIVPELLLGLAIFALYSVVASDDRHRQAEAVRNGRWLFAAEQWLHLDIEPALDADEAFQLLRAYSQDSNVKVHTLAERLVDLVARDGEPNQEFLRRVLTIFDRVA